jgi:transcriptional regulator with XRE-family HTH domain
MRAVTVGQRVRELRKARGWTQERLAQAARIGHSTVEDIERARRVQMPQTETLARIADALGVGVCALIGYPCERDGNALARMQIQALRDRLYELETLVSAR